MALSHIFAAACLVIGAIHANPIEFDRPEDTVFPPLSANLNLLDETVPLSEYRLTDDVVPINYKIDLRPYFEKTGEKEAFTFDGSVEITFRANRDVSSVTLHGKELVVDQERWALLTETSVAIDRGSEATYVPATHKWTFPRQEGVFEAGKVYKLRIIYTGVLDDTMRGFYRSYYNQDGQRQWIGSTQFQSTDGRKAFPCFDEPRFKATFDVTITRPREFNVTVSNTKVKSSIEQGDVTVDTFETTPKMSSYILAFVVQDYDFEQTEDEHFGVYARPQAKNQTKYAFDVGQQLLAKMGEWIDYPFNRVPEIQKLDMIAVPDFSAGAMENWGAMTYRESSLLWDETDSTAMNQQRIAAVLTHEIAHLWFGDLVTCDWWGETWLNEGFARFFQYFGTHLVESKWNLEEQFVIEQVQGSFQLDSTPNTHPMTNPNVFTPEQASNMFDNISYNKAASILRWIQHYMGKERFQKALQKYIKEHEYEAVLPEHLFTAFEREAPGLRITSIFTPWTTQSGYPLISVHPHDDHLHFTQKRFFLEPREDATRWDIPLTVATNSSDFESTATRFIFPIGQTDYERDVPRDGDLPFYLVNIQQVGFYRVNYDSRNWNAIRQFLNSDRFETIPVINRAQIVDDLFNLAQAAEVDYSLVLDVTDYLARERNYIPWLAAFNGLAYLSRRIANNDLAGIFESHIRSIVVPVYDHLKFHPQDTDTHIDTLNRVNVLNWACKHGHQDCVDKAKEEFTKLRQGQHVINPNIRIPVYCEGIRQGGRDEYTFLWNKYLTTNVAHEQVVILQALGCTKDRTLLYDFLGRILTDAIRPQDKSSSFTNAFAGNHDNVDIVLDYLIEKFRDWEPIMGPVSSSISSLSSRFTREEQVQKVEKFAADSSAALGEAQVTRLGQVADNSRKNIGWDDRRLKEVRDWNAKKTDDGPKAAQASLSVLLLSMTAYFFMY